MVIWQPIINCGFNSGDLPMIFIAEYSSKHGFKSEKECEDWIESNNEYCTLDELAGGIYPAFFDVDDYEYID